MTDITRTLQGSLWLKAFRLSPEFMQTHKAQDFTPQTYHSCIHAFTINSSYACSHVSHLPMGTPQAQGSQSAVRQHSCRGAHQAPQFISSQGSAFGDCPAFRGVFECVVLLTSTLTAWIPYSLQSTWISTPTPISRRTYSCSSALSTTSHCA